MEPSMTQQAHQQFTVTIRTPAGQPGAFSVTTQERVDKVVRTAVDFFINRGELSQGDYGLAEVKDGTSQTLVDSNRLEDYGVTAQTDLRLVSKQPHVDG